MKKTIAAFTIVAALCIGNVGFADEAKNADIRKLIEARDFIGLIHYGVIFFSIEKMAAVLGLSNPDVYAQMRGETMEEFQKSRNVNMQYSVAGKEDD